MAKVTDPTAALVALYTQNADDANSIVERVVNSRGNHAKSLSQWRDESDDAIAVEWREFYEKVQKAIEAKRAEVDAAGAKALNFTVMSDEEVKAAQEEYAPKAKAAKDAKALLESLAAMTGADVPELPEVKRFSGKSGGTGAGTGNGPARPRWDRVEFNGTQVEGKQTLTNVAGLIAKDSGVKVKPSEILDALLKEAGTDAASITDVSVPFSVTDSDGKTTSYNVHVYRDQTQEADADSK